MSNTKAFSEITRRTGAVLATALVLAVSFAANAQPKTLGFVITTWNTGLYESKFVDECPEGFNIGYDEIWWRGFRSPSAHA